LIFLVVLVVVDFRGVAEGVAPLGAGEDAGKSEKIFI
jgi:hypothetical protein